MIGTSEPYLSNLRINNLSIKNHNLYAQKIHFAPLLTNHGLISRC